MDTYQAIVNHYGNIFGAVTGNRYFTFNPKPVQQKQINNFVKLLQKEVSSFLDEEFIFFFLCFQYEKRKDLRTRFGVGIVPLNHVIGKKALDKWLRRSDNANYWIQKFIQDYNIPVPNKKRDVKYIPDLIEFEERLRLKFKSSDELFFHCQQLTNLYHPKSKICISCQFKVECVDLQKAIYPEIHEARKG